MKEISTQFNNALSIKGVMDLHGGTSSLYGSLDGKAVHLKVSANIPDLSIYSLDVVSNGGGSLDPSSFVLSGSANAGDNILVYRIGNGDSSVMMEGHIYWPREEFGVKISKFSGD